MKRKRTRNLVSLVMTVILSMVVVFPVQATPKEETKTQIAAVTEDLSGQLVILHTNDTHGRDMEAEGESIGTAGVSKLKKAYEAAGADVLLFSAGDAIQGKPLVNVSHGVTAIEFMSLAEYDLMVPGNHEFDFGLDNLIDLSGRAHFPMVAANITYKDSGETLFDASRIFTTPQGYKVGVFGLDTPETLTKAHPDNVKGLDFASGNELYTCAQEQIDFLKAEGCEIIVCVGHLGVDDASAPNRSIDVMMNTNGIHLFIDGHSHTEIPGGIVINGGLLTSTGSYLENVGVVQYDRESLQASLLSAKDYAGGYDETVRTVVDYYEALIEAEYGQVFAKTEVNLNGTRSGGDVTDSEGKVLASFPEGEGNRTKETNLGDFAADAMRFMGEKAAGQKVDVAITNGGGIRETILAGDITKNDMITVFPFGNEIVLLQISGAGLLEVLEASCSAAPEPLGGFPQVSGMSYIVDTTVPYANGPQYPDSTYFAPAEPGSRVKNVMIHGEPLDLDKMYTVATNDFSAAGGDTCYAFKAAYEKTGIPTGLNLEDALIQYITEELGGVIGSEYAVPQGRITVSAVPAAQLEKTPMVLPGLSEEKSAA